MSLLSERVLFVPGSNTEPEQLDGWGEDLSANTAEHLVIRENYSDTNPDYDGIITQTQNFLTEASEPAIVLAHSLGAPIARKAIMGVESRVKLLVTMAGFHRERSYRDGEVPYDDFPFVLVTIRGTRDSKLMQKFSHHPKADRFYEVDSDHTSFIFDPWVRQEILTIAGNHI